MNLWVQESYVNRTKDMRYGDTEVYESFTDDVGQLYRAMQREYGRCESAVYIDRGGESVRIGWVFVKRAEYEGSRETYLQETWVTLHDAPPTVSREVHYHEIAS